jgi:hypothetical protein
MFFPYLKKFLTHLMLPIFLFFRKVNQLIVSFDELSVKRQRVTYVYVNIELIDFVTLALTEMSNKNSE